MLQLHSTSLLVAASASLAIASVAAAAIGVRQRQRRGVWWWIAANLGLADRAGDPRPRRSERPARTDRRRARPAMAGGHAGRHAALSSRAAAAAFPPGPTPSSSAPRCSSCSAPGTCRGAKRSRPSSSSARCCSRPCTPRSPSGASRTSRRRRSCTACSSPWSAAPSLQAAWWAIASLPAGAGADRRRPDPRRLARAGRRRPADAAARPGDDPRAQRRPAARLAPQASPHGRGRSAHPPAQPPPLPRARGQGDPAAAGADDGAGVRRRPAEA